MVYFYTHIEGSGPQWYISTLISRVPDHNGISRLYNMLEMYYFGPEPSIYSRDIPLWSETIRFSWYRRGTIPHLLLSRYREASVPTNTSIVKPADIRQHRMHCGGIAALSASFNVFSTRLYGWTCGVIVSTSAFLACHQC